MNSEERLERLVRKGFEAFNRRDRDAMVSILDENVESHVAPGLANAGTWHGVEGFESMVAIWSEAFETQRNTVLSIRFPDEHHAIAEVHQAAVGAGSGVPVEMTLYYLFEVHDERAVRVHLYPDADAALAAVR